jgi:hypothetical protein
LNFSLDAASSSNPASSDPFPGKFFNPRKGSPAQAALLLFVDLFKRSVHVQNANLIAA